MKKYGMIIAIIGTSIFTVICFIVAVCLNGWKKMFEINIVDLLTFSIVSIALFLVSQVSVQKDKKNIKMENIITFVVSKLQEICLIIPSEDNRAEYLYRFKNLSNKFEVLKSICDNKDKQYIENAQNKFENLREYIIDNLNMGLDYFEDSSRKGKIHNIVTNIENELDKIIIKIYS